MKEITWKSNIYSELHRNFFLHSNVNIFVFFSHWICVCTIIIAWFTRGAIIVFKLNGGRVLMCNKYHSMSAIDRTKNHINFCLSACRLHVKIMLLIRMAITYTTTGKWNRNILFCKQSSNKLVKQTQRGNHVSNYTVDQREQNVCIVNTEFTEGKKIL